MQNVTFHRLAVQCGLIFFFLISGAAATQVEIVGTLRNTQGVPLSGRISIFQEVPHLVADYYPVDNTGVFRIAGNSQGGLVVHAASAHHASVEHVIQPEASGVVHIDFVLAPGQDIQGRVVDVFGNGVPDAVVHVRYHEPDRPVRRLLFGPDERTDGDGRFLIRDVGIQVPFVVDVLAPDYPPISSRRTRLREGETTLEDIVLGERGGSVVVQVLDEFDSPVPDAAVTLLADPAGLDVGARGSWLHHRAFRQRAITSRLGNARFQGVPPGRIIVRVKASRGAAKQRAVVSPGEELRLTIRIL